MATSISAVQTRHLCSPVNKQQEAGRVNSGSNLERISLNANNAGLNTCVVPRPESLFALSSRKSVLYFTSKAFSFNEICV
jgi:hypothetical protein